MLSILGFLLSIVCLVAAFFMFSNLCSVANNDSPSKVRDLSSVLWGGLVVCVFCGGLAFGCFYYYLNPVSRGFYKKQETYEYDTLRTEKELLCESVAFQFSDDCIVLKIDKIQKKVVVTYGEKVSQIVNEEPEGIKLK